MRDIIGVELFTIKTNAAALGVKKRPAYRRAVKIFRKNAEAKGYEYLMMSQSQEEILIYFNFLT